MTKGSLVLFAFFVLLGLASLGFGIRNYLNMQEFFRTAEHATAKIVEFRPDRNPKAADFCPRYEFTTKKGETVGFEGDDCLATPDRSLIGKTEEVYFDPANPQSIYTRGWTGNEGTWLIMGIIGFVFFLIIGGLSPLTAFIASRSKR
ncbi:MAG: DUF3592 domain-containing protein [Acidobacteria bacterium ACB1]|nr:DUF3592 domain-containing protein [Acidobacteria bacterium ACB1]RIJ94539.1 MAG: hypothetical protein DCC44_04230 [Acidobacteriota bacterium]